LKLNRYNEEKEGEYFRKLVLALIRKDFQSAVRQVRDYYPRYLNLLPGETLFRIGVTFYQSADFEKARLCLELASGEEGPWQCKAILILSHVYEVLGNTERARSILLDLMDRQPDAIFYRQVNQRLMELEQGDNQIHKFTTTG
jgi:tetratricopeptide (TPR) repeat protein